MKEEIDEEEGNKKYRNCSYFSAFFKIMGAGEGVEVVYQDPDSLGI